MDNTKITHDEALAIICTSETLITDGDTGIAIEVTGNDNAPRISFYDEKNEENNVVVNSAQLTQCQWYLSNDGNWIIAKDNNDNEIWSGRVHLAPKSFEDVLNAIKD